MSDITMLNVEAIREHPNQPRVNKGNLKALIASIEEVGLVEPLAVAEATNGDAGYYVISGHRRLAALKEMGTKQVPCRILFGSVSDTELLDTISSLTAANSAREDFTDAEKAKVFQTMMDLGLKSDSIARLSAEPKRLVEQAVTAFTKMKTVEGVTNPDDLSLDEAVALAYADEHVELVPSGVNDLLEYAGTEEFDHAAARLEQQVRDAEEQKAVMDEYPAELRWLHGFCPTAQALTGLTTKEGEPLTPENHAECPGHAAQYMPYWREKVCFICDDWKKHGHKEKRQASSTQTKEQEQATAGRKFKKEGIAPTEVRRTFLKEKLFAGDVTKLKGVYTYMAGCAVDRESNAGSDLFWQLIGKKAPSWEKRSELFAKLTGQQAAKALLASYVAPNDEDARLSQGAWHFRTKSLPRYFKFLKANGYTLSEHEQELTTYEARTSYYSAPASEEE